MNAVRRAVARTSLGVSGRSSASSSSILNPQTCSSSSRSSTSTCYSGGAPSPSNPQQVRAFSNLATMLDCRRSSPNKEDSRLHGGRSKDLSRKESFSTQKAPSEDDKEQLVNTERLLREQLEERMAALPSSTSSEGTSTGQKMTAEELKLSSNFAVNLGRMAVLHRSVGQITEAERLLQESLELSRQVHGNNHPHVAVTLNELAQLYRSVGQVERAEAALRESLRVFRVVCDGDDASPHVAVALQELALLLTSLPAGTSSGGGGGGGGRDKAQIFDEAEGLLLESLALKSKVAGEESGNVALTLGHLGVLHRNHIADGTGGQFLESERMFRESLAIFRKNAEEGGGGGGGGGGGETSSAASSSSPAGRHVAITAGELALLLRDFSAPSEEGQGQGPRSSGAQLQEAESLFRESLSLKRRELGEESVHVAMTRQELGVLLLAKAGGGEEEGALEEAEGLFRKSLAVLERSFPGGHPRVLAASTALQDAVQRRQQ